jgi:hypothetical protein
MISLRKIVMDEFNSIEQEIINYLKKSPVTFVTTTEISRNVGQRKWFNADRFWSRPILRRLEMDGWVESNPFGEYRLKKRPDGSTTFRQALGVPGMALADTTIITETETIENAPETDQHLKGGMSF